MSTREYAIELINNMSDEQLTEFIMFLGETENCEKFNAETLVAMNEVEYMKKHPDEYKGYTNAEDMMKELLA